MYVIVVQLKVKPEKIQDFMVLTLDNARKSRKEPGCVRFDVLRNETETDRFVFYEVYKDRDAHKAHQATEHYLRWKEGVVDLLAEPRISGRYLNVSPEDSEW